MWIADNWKDYECIDTANGEKLERWGSIILCRPDPQVIWDKKSNPELWEKSDARYFRSSSGGGKWEYNNKMPEKWCVKYKDLTFNIKPMGFKHTGLFPEQAVNWDYMAEKIRQRGSAKVLNLFAYTGGATVACAKAGANVTHVDASKGMVQWAKENARSSGLENAPIRYLVDDCMKFVEREIRRGN
ncbi:MAG: class I SAM-dependent methyltransferase, partial [Clostridia bacterium]|nr:class I SAM-dependent methyltransferase [Clostridia bacterium]